MFYINIFKKFCLYTKLFTFKDTVVRVYKHVTKKNKIYLSCMVSGGMFVVSFFGFI